MRLRKQISLFLSFAISITSMNVTALSNSISGMTKKAKAADIVLASSPEPTSNASAAAMDADMRVIFTTDIHGQVVNYDYQSAKEVNRGLNKAYTLVKRREMRLEQEIILHLTSVTVCMILLQITYIIMSLRHCSRFIML